MSTLEGKNISATYQTLLKTTSDSGIGTTIGTIEDGKGNVSPLSLSVNNAAISGKFGIGITSPTSQLHIVTSGAQPVLVTDSSSNEQFYVGDANSNFNVKLGDITDASSGNDTVLFVEDSSSRIVATTTSFGVNNSSPTATLHVGNNTGTAKFSLSSSTSAFDINDIFTVDTTNSEITVGGRLKLENRLDDSGDYYKLEEYFYKRPRLNADLDDTDDETEFVAANQNFEVLGTNATSALVDWSTNYGGINVTTAGADNDQIIILPHLDTREDSQPHTAWSGVKFGTENSTEWKCAITTPSAITTMSFWAGMKLTNVPAYATDDNQAYFLFATDDDHGALTTNGNLHFIYSVAGTDFITDLGVTVAASTTYKLELRFDASRQISVFCNGVQKGLVTTATAGGATQSTATTKSNAMTDDIDLIPYMGVQQHAGSITRNLEMHYQKIQRLLFE
jgi:hypothetical protein